MPEAIQSQAERQLSVPSLRDVLACPTLLTAPTPCLKEGSLYKGEPALLYSFSEVDTLAAPFSLTLIGKFSHDSSTMEFYARALAPSASRANINWDYLLTITFWFASSSRRTIIVVRCMALGVLKSISWRSSNGRHSSLLLMNAHMPHSGFHFLISQFIFSRRVSSSLWLLWLVGFWRLMPLPRICLALLWLVFMWR